MSRYCVLIVDDETDIRVAVKAYLEANGYRVEEAETCAAALDAFGRSRPDGVILDYLLADGTALDLLPRFREVDPSVPVVVLTGHGSIDLAVRAIKEGAEQFLTKPVELSALRVVLERVFENQRNRQRQLATDSRKNRRTLDPFVGTSAQVRHLAKMAAKVAGSDSNAFIVGETGSGKGVLAKWLHNNSSRADEPFVDVNCAGLSTELLDSELFGHERGSFTSAVKEKPGLLEIAHRGMLFMDEIGDMPAQVQPKLLKVLEERRFRRLGSVRDRVVDVRLITATHRDLTVAMRSGAFRHDLYYRINTIQLEVPPLRDRPEDIAILARQVLTRLAADLGRPRVRLGDAAERVLRQYAWPGNVRELRNVLERALLLNDGDTLEVPDLLFDGVPPPSSSPMVATSATLREVEVLHIERVLEEERGRVPAAAKRLGVPKSSLYQKLKSYGIDVSRFRSEASGTGISDAV